MRAEDDVSKLTGDLYRQWEKSMETWWDGVLESPDFLKGMGKNLEAQGKARKQYEEGVDKTMGDLHLRFLNTAAKTPNCDTFRRIRRRFAESDARGSPGRRLWAFRRRALVGETPALLNFAIGGPTGSAKREIQRGSVAATAPRSP